MTHHPPMADGIPGRQHLTGYRLRGYDHAIAVLWRSREAQGITQQALGERVGVGQPAISDALRGVTEVGGSRLFDIARALGYDLALIPRGSESEWGDYPPLQETYPGSGIYE